jgi:GT2 family glycosyltransferase
VVIDHNTQLLERLTQQIVPQEPLLTVIPNSRKQGLSGARNTALEQVTAEIVVFLDDDAAAEPGWLQALVEPYEEPTVIAVGGVAEPSWPAGHRRPKTLPAALDEGRGELDWVVGCTYQGQPVDTQRVRNLMGCNMSFRRSVFGVVAGFSEDLGRVGKIPLGCEETELCIRATAALPEGQILFEPRARVTHQVSVDRLSWKYLLRRSFAEGLSKAAVSHMVGPSRALETERRYASRVLPLGVLRQLRRAVTGGASALGAVQGAGAIVLALGATISGYVRARSVRATVLNSSSPRLDIV